MSRTESYRIILRSLDDWDSFLLQESRLPGPRGNLELAQAVADEGDLDRFSHFLTFDPQLAPTNTPGEFVAFCGVLGLGKMIAQGRIDLLPQLRGCASDPRWRVREAVAMALQRLGRVDMPRLLAEIESWKLGNYLEQRAVVAGLAEPDLLGDADHNLHILSLLDQITASVAEAADRRNEAFLALRQALGYCWSVVVAASPEAGKPLMEKWMTDLDRDIQWIMKENLKKKRLQTADPSWAQIWRSKLERRPD